MPPRRWANRVPVQRCIHGSGILVDIHPRQAWPIPWRHIGPSLRRRSAAAWTIQIQWARKTAATSISPTSPAIWPIILGEPGDRLYNFGIVTCEQGVVERFGLYNNYMATACYDVPYRRINDFISEAAPPHALHRYPTGKLHVDGGGPWRCAPGAAVSVNSQHREGRAEGSRALRASPRHRWQGEGAQPDVTQQCR